MNDSLIVLTGEEVAELLRGKDREIVDVVKAAYVAHGRGRTCIPHSSFLHFPGDPASRIIALPAYVETEEAIAGVKWISSFPSNVLSGLDRASAAIVLNSCLTGRPQVILEGSIISAKRTAGSAALAASMLHPAGDAARLGIVGCGLINREICEFLSWLLRKIDRLVVYDRIYDRAHQFLAGCKLAERCYSSVAPDIATLLRDTNLVSFATTSAVPYVESLALCPRPATLLHISLRDLSPEAVLACDNVVDDADHVCRANTSLHLAEQKMGNRAFIRCSIADIIEGKAPGRSGTDAPVVFSPFGLGVLDLSVAKLVCGLATSAGIGTTISSFFPKSWVRTANIGV